jgi:L-alanine-DL-glutamate epimerase-like enolase superfamily enzyme
MGDLMIITGVHTAVIQGNFDWILVRVSTDSGVTGLGEAYWGAGVEDLIHRLREIVVGQNAFDIGRLYEKMIRGMSGEGSLAGATVTAISGIEIAVWDAIARKLNTPLYNLFGGRFRDKIRLYADCHHGDEPAPESCAERAKSIVERGFSAIKFDLDAPNPYTRDISDDPDPRRDWYEPYNRTISSEEREYMVAVVAAVRDAVGPGVMLAMDCHWKYSTTDAIRLARALERFDLAWLEDPIPPENIDAQLTVTRSTSTPICTGENLYRTAGFRELIEKQAADIIAPDIPKMGGLMEAKKVADHAGMYYMPVAPHNVCSPVGTIAAAHICAAMQNFLVLEFHAVDLPWWSELVTGGPAIKDGFLQLNDAPGNGLELNEDVARNHLKPGSTLFE